MQLIQKTGRYLKVQRLLSWLVNVLQPIVSLSQLDIRQIHNCIGIEC